MEKPRKRRFEVLVIAERCKECGMCIHVCPKNVLEVGKKSNSRGFYVTIPARPEDCVGCRICEYICPDFAIVVRESSDGHPRGIIQWSEDRVDEVAPPSGREEAVVRA